MMEGLQGELIWPEAGRITTAKATASNGIVRVRRTNEAIWDSS